jgi:hypothetical protein
LDERLAGQRVDFGSGDGAQGKQAKAGEQGRAEGADHRKNLGRIGTAGSRK